MARSTRKPPRKPPPKGLPPAVRAVHKKRQRAITALAAVPPAANPKPPVPEPDFAMRSQLLAPGRATQEPPHQYARAAHTALGIEVSDTPLPLRVAAAADGSGLAKPALMGVPLSADAAVFGGNRVEPTVEHNAKAVAQGAAIAEATGTVVWGAFVTLPAAWAAERDQILRRLSDIRSALSEIHPLVQSIERSILPHRDGIGGNDPPEAIDPPPISTTDLAEIAAAGRVLAGLGDGQQQIAPIELSHLVLKRAEPKVGALSAWLKSKGNLFVDEFIKGAASQAGKRSVDALYLIGVVATLSTAIGYVLNRVEHLLQALHLMP